MAWYVLHCPPIMSAASPPGDSFTPFVQRLESAKWEGGYMVRIRQILSRDTHYHIFRCFPDFEGGIYGAEYQDAAGPNGFTQLSGGVFHWLLSIRPRYLIFRQGDRCFLEPYHPIGSLANLGMISCTSGILVLNSQLWVIYMKEPGLGIILWQVVPRPSSGFPIKHPTPTLP